MKKFPTERVCILTGLDSFRHVFIEKMPQLEPELMSMTGLNLYTTLCGMAKTANANLSTPLDEEMVNGMDMLWGVALRARNPEVSFHSMQYLNNYYITCKSLIRSYMFRFDLTFQFKEILHISNFGVHCFG